MGKPDSFLTSPLIVECCFFFPITSLVVYPQGCFFHVNPSQQHEWDPSVWQYYCNATLTLLAPVCQKNCNTQNAQGGFVLTCSCAAFVELISFGWVIIVVSTFWGVSRACCSVTCSACLLSNIRLNQFQNVVLNESWHASAHSLWCHDDVWFWCVYLEKVSV